MLRASVLGSDAMAPLPSLRPTAAVSPAPLTAKGTDNTTAGPHPVPWPLVIGRGVSTGPTLVPPLVPPAVVRCRLPLVNRKVCHARPGAGLPGKPSGALWTLPWARGGGDPHRIGVPLRLRSLKWTMRRMRSDQGPWEPPAPFPWTLDPDFTVGKNEMYKRRY